MSDNHNTGLSHARVETSNFLMIVLILLAVAFGGIVEIVPLFFQKSTTTPVEGVKPYDAVRLVGRDVYIREGCYNCHSQMIRPFRAETERYGHYSVAGEYVYDHPFQWGSKRTGPDLAREGGLRSNFWHYQHMIRPKDVSQGSIMPAYIWMDDENSLDLSMIESKISAMQTLGVPYVKGYEKQAKADAEKQAEEIALNIVTDISNSLPKDVKKTYNIKSETAKMKTKEVVALIAYLQRLGTDIKAKADTKTANK